MNDSSTPPPVDPSQSSSGVPQCYRHPGRETYIGCQRCGRKICPDCMRDAAVGFQCPECVSRGAKETRSGLGPYGGRRSADPRRTSFALIAINVAVWVAVLVTGGNRSRLTDWLMLTPVGRCTTSDGAQWYPGAVNSGLCDTVGGAVWHPGVADGAVWQILTSAFTHVGVMHVALNCIGLFILGPVLEQALGRVRMLAVYTVSVFAAGATIMLFADPASSTLGASGGVFGLMGALLIVSWRTGGDVRQILMLLAINAVVTITIPNISWQGHLGGFLGGAAAAAVIVFSPRGAQRSKWQGAGMAGLLVVTALVIAARALTLP